MAVDTNVGLLLKLSDASGIGGDEQEVMNIVSNFLNKKAYFDGLGSALFKYQNNDRLPLIMLATHSDEVGFVVSGLNEDGSCTVQQVGNIWNHLVLSQDVIVKTQDGRSVFGVIGCPITHGMDADEKKRVVDDSKVYIDFGVNNREELENLGVKIGDSVTFNTQACILNNSKFISGKAMDNRVSLHVGSIVANEVNMTDNHNFILAATVQEEVGLRGARTVAHKILPDLCIVLDTTVSKSYIDNVDVELGKGVVINIIDSMTLMNRGLLRYVESLCDKHKIKNQLGMFMDGGTDSGNIHKSNTGILTINIGIPIRYMHSQRSIVHEDDIEAAASLIMSIIQDISFEKLERINQENYTFKE